MSQSSSEYVGPYRLTSLMMTGQTSQVWEVVRRGEPKRMALKMLLKQFKKDKEHVGYMKNEYLVGKALEHPNVIRIFEMGSHEGGPYLVMDLFPWPNMKLFLQRALEQIGYLLPEVIRQAATGLQHLHEQGWVHRDIKPDNFLMSVDGDVKLIDFALAQKKSGLMGKLFGSRGKPQGTMSYMSPEQIRCEAFDHRADVYSFGCTIHHLVYGKPPFAAGTAKELLQKHLKSPPPPLTALHKNVTDEFASLVVQMLAKKPQDRIQSIDKFMQAFRTVRIFKSPPRAPKELVVPEKEEG